MTKKDLCFFTNSYPYGNGETFIENELNYIAPFFETVYLFHKTKTGKLREVPNNVKLIYIELPNSQSIKAIYKNNFLTFFYLVINEFLFSSQKKIFLGNFKYNLSHFFNCIYYSTQIQKHLNDTVLKEAYFYSYWFFDWNLSLSILKSKKIIGCNITRTHGFDLYENNGKPNYLPARKFCLSNTDKVFTISHVGENYLKILYPKYKSKIFCSYLGTKDFGNNPIPIAESPIHIVSCSNVNQVKRIDLIIDILKYINLPVLWTHIGDGVLLEEMKYKSKELPENVIVDFKGVLTQKQIFEFYSKTPIDIFINCSVSEGLPVSIMEAISFGIPVIATDVGGTSEIVNKITGILIDKNFDSEKIAKQIISLKKLSILEDYRSNVKLFWKNNFFSDTNYSFLLKNFI